MIEEIEKEPDIKKELVIENELDFKNEPDIRKHQDHLYQKIEYLDEKIIEDIEKEPDIELAIENELDIRKQILDFLDKNDPEDINSITIFLSKSKELLSNIFNNSPNTEEKVLGFIRALELMEVTVNSLEETKKSKFRNSFGLLMENLLIPPLEQIDWRILRKISALARSELLPNTSRLIRNDLIVLGWERELTKALDSLDWENVDKKNIKETKLILENLKSNMQGSDSKKIILKEALLTGRFDKNIFGLKFSLILASDGGLFALINILTDETKKILKTLSKKTDDHLGLNKITDDYFKEKTTKVEKDKGTVEEIILGIGGFGKVKITMAVFSSGATNPGDILCVKKSKSFELLSKIK